ncbi:MAG: GIY-YIG nuclease family protein [Candidatus Scalindua sp.]
MYILKSLKDNGIYIGMSRDPEDRLKQHNKGKTVSTKSRRPFVMLYKEEYNSADEARKREQYCKSGIGREQIKQKINSSVAQR